MKVEISRFKDGKLMAVVQHEKNSYFRPQEATECLVFDDQKLRTEVLLMVDWWNRKYHNEFEEFWNYLRNIFYFSKGNGKKIEKSFHFPLIESRWGRKE